MEGAKGKRKCPGLALHPEYTQEPREISCSKTQASTSVAHLTGVHFCMSGHHQWRPLLRHLCP